MQSLRKLHKRSKLVLEKNCVWSHLNFLCNRLCWPPLEARIKCVVHCVTDLLTIWTIFLCQFVINVQGFLSDLAWKEPFFLFFTLTSNLLCQVMRIRGSIIKEMYYSLGIHKRKHHMIRGISLTGKNHSLLASCQLWVGQNSIIVRGKWLPIDVKFTSNFWTPWSKY